MSDDMEDKYVRFVAKLIELTQLNKLTWKALNEDYYVSYINGRSLEVSRSDRELVQTGLAALSLGGASYRRNYTLRIGKTDDADMFSIVNQYGVQNLFTSVVLATTKVEPFIDSVLSDK